jgi:hypothetical protein
MVIVDDMGDEVGTLDQLLRGMKDLMEDNTCLRKRIESLSADLTSQGRVILNGLGFTSEAKVKETVMRECPDRDAFKVFLDVMLLWCCDTGFSPVTNWENMAQAMEEDYSPTARKVVAVLPDALLVVLGGEACGGGKGPGRIQGCQQVEWFE